MRSIYVTLDMKFFRKKKKCKSASTFSQKVSKIGKSGTVGSIEKTRAREVDSMIDLVFDSHDPCAVDYGFESGMFSVEYLKPVPIRQITLSEENGEYGFYLKKKILPDISNFRRKQVVFIDSETQSAILGDRLISVEGTVVDDMSCEEVASHIIMCGQRVVCQIQRLREFTEIYKFLLNYDQVNLWFNFSEDRSITSPHSNYWFIHRYGFIGCDAHLGETEETSVTVPQLDFKPMTVPSDALEKMNPKELDFIEDCSNLWYLNECGILHNIRCRYLNSLYNTFVGRSLVCVNSSMPSISLSDRMSEMFYSQIKPDSLPPHIYSVAQRVYQSMQFESKTSQTIAFLGYTGSAKSEAFKDSMAHLLRTPHTHNLNRFTMAKWNALYNVLNSLTSLHPNGLVSDLVVNATLHYDSIGSLIGGAVKIELFDSFLMLDHRNFYIVRCMLAGLDTTIKRKYMLSDDITSLMTECKKWNALCQNLDFESYFVRKD